MNHRGHFAYSTPQGIGGMMKRTAVAMFVVVLVGISNLLADTTTFNSNAVIEDGDIYDIVVVVGDNTVVNMTGGNVNNLYTYDDSVVILKGGRIDAMLKTFNTSMADVRGGSCEYIRTYELSTANISGGNHYTVGAYDTSEITISGSSLFWVTCSNNATMEISDGDLYFIGAHNATNITGGEIQLLDATSGSAHVYGYGFSYNPQGGEVGYGYITGFWNNLMPFNISMKKTTTYDNIVFHGSVPPQVASIQIKGPTEVNEYSDAQYTCTAYYDNGYSVDVTSSVIWNENSNYANINSSGYLSALEVDSDQPCQITATYEGKLDTHDVTIKDMLTIYTISGYVRTSGGTGIEGVSMGGLPGGVTTSSSGFYTATVTNGWTGTITPSLAGYSFIPASRNYSSVTTDQPNQDFRACSIPNEVRNLVLSGGPEQLTVHWDDPNYDGGLLIEQFNIYRGPSELALTFLAQAAGNVPEYVDTEVVNGQTYFYSVSAVNGFGEGDLCPSVQAIAQWHALDINGDGVIDMTDFAMFCQDWLWQAWWHE